VSKLLIELAKSKLAGQSLPDLIANLKEPIESSEFRIKIGLDDFKSHGEYVIEKMKEFASMQADWEIVPNNYEGVRISCPTSSEDGWFLLRLSLHDPVMPLNIESNVQRGVAQIANRLLGFFQTIESLDLPDRLLEF
jgi:phosphomannomutase